MRTKLLLFILTALIILFVGPSFVSAAENSCPGLIPCGCTNGPPCNICHIFTLLQRVLNFLWWYISVPLATLMLAYAGFLLMIPSLGSGSPPMITKGKKVLKNTVVGIMIVFFSWLFIDTIIKVIAGQNLGSGKAADIGGWGPWNEVRCDASKSASVPERNNSVVAVENSSETATLKPNTRAQLIALTSFLLQNDSVFAAEVQKLLKEAESSPASRKFFLEINGTNPAPSIIIWKEITWIKNIEIHGLSLSFLASIVSQFAQKFFPGVKAAFLSISSVTPKEATPGSTVVIRGVGFTPTDNTFNLTFPDGTVAIYNDIPSEDNGTIIQGVVPQTIIIGGRYTFFISNENGVSNTATLDIIVNAANFIVNQLDIRELGGDQGNQGSQVDQGNQGEEGGLGMGFTVSGGGIISGPVPSPGPVTVNVDIDNGTVTATGPNGVTVSGSISVTPDTVTISLGNVTLGNISLTVDLGENGNIIGMTTSTNTGSGGQIDVTVTPTGPNTATVTTTDENGQTVSSTATIGPIGGNVDALSGPPDSDAPQTSNTEGEGPGGGVDAGGGAGLGGTGAGEGDGGSTPDASDGAPDF